MRKRIVGLAILGVALILTGCLGGGGDGTGILAVSLTDAPANDIAHVWITVESVSVQSPGSGWITLTDVENEGTTVDLLALRFSEELLGEKEVPAGKYTQLRMKLTDAWVEDWEGNTIKFTVPSSKLKSQKNFQVPSGVVTELVMDLDVLEFIRWKENQNEYKMRPTAFRVIPRVVLGTVEGRVGVLQDNEFAALDEDVIIELYNGDEIVASTLALREPQDDHEAGWYRLNVTEGTYRLEAYTLDENNMRILEAKRDNIVVKLGENELEDIILKPVEG